MYLALDGAVERYAAGTGWTSLAPQIAPARGGCPTLTQIDSFSVAPAGRWAMTVRSAFCAWLETGGGGTHRLVRGWDGQVWTTPAGYALWGGHVTHVDMDTAIVEAYRAYASADGVSWAPAGAGVFPPGQQVAVGGGVVYRLWQSGESAPPRLDVSHDGGQTWVQHRLWAPAQDYDLLWAGPGVVAVSACSVCGGAPGEVHADTLYVSTDGGATWHGVKGLPQTVPVATGSTGHILDVAVAGDRLWVAVGYPPYWYTGVLP